jgi:hypothetical protein
MIKKEIQFVGPNITPQTGTIVFGKLYNGPGREYQVKHLSAQYDPQEFTDIVYDLVQSQLHNYVL